MDAKFACFFDLVHIYEPLVDLIGTLEHSLHIVHVIVPPVAQLSITACLFQVRRLSNHQLIHFVYEEALAP